MAVIKFERHITRFELNNQTILVEDDQGNDHGLKFPGFNLIVKTPDKNYPASLRDFYVGSKFKPGVAFDHEEGHLNDFFFDQSVSENKRARITFNTDDAPIDGRIPVEIEVYMVIKEH